MNQLSARNLPRDLLIGVSGIAFGALFAVAILVMVRPTIAPKEVAVSATRAHHQTFEQFVDGPHTPEQEAELAQIAADNGAERAAARESDDQVRSPTGQPANSDAARRPERFTKAEFESYIANRTKAQVRDEFGPPDRIDDREDDWFYLHIPVYDAEAEIQVSVTIRFAGIDGPKDFAVDASY